MLARSLLFLALCMGCLMSRLAALSAAGGAAAARGVQDTSECPDGAPAAREQVLRFPGNDALSARVGSMVAELCAASAARKGPFLVALSGGSLPQLLAQGLLAHADKIDFSQWHVFFADERYVAHDHADSNLLACRKEFLSKVSGIKPEHVYGIDVSVPIAEAARRYEQQLEKATGLSRAKGQLPRFDLVLLGMGPDGHTCSLFPGHALLGETAVWVAPIADSPKAPPQRITLTYPVLNNAANVWFLAAGASKADVIPLTAGLSAQQVQALGDKALPAARVRPTKGSLIWFIDDAAAAKL
jgi:6-phosphogluconolactonase